MTTSNGFSHLDEAGIDHIETTREARFDLRDHALTREDLGVGPDSLGPIVGGARSPQISVQLLAPERTEEVRTSTFSVAFNGSGAKADYLTWFERYDTAREADAALAEAVERWGFRRADLTYWQRALDAAGAEQQTFALPAALSPSGLLVEAILRGTKDGGQTHQYQVLLDPTYYTPEALEGLRRTGRLPR